MKKYDYAFSCFVAVFAFVIAVLFCVLIIGGCSDSATIKKNRVEQRIKDNSYEYRQKLYEVFHSVASGFGGTANNVNVTNFKVDDDLSNCSFRLTIYWDTLLTPNGITEIDCSAKNNGSGWQIDPDSVKLIYTNGMTDADFLGNCAAGLLYLLL